MTATRPTADLDLVRKLLADSSSTLTLAEAVAELTARTRARGGVAAVWGQWPGDEGDEEIDAALREMS